MARIPIDVIVSEILTKLPIKSLIRFKYVSKYYQALISSQEFSDLHSRVSQSSDVKNNNNRLYIRIDKAQTYVHSVDLASQEPESPPSVALPLPPTSRLLNFFVGCCNGLHCIGTIGTIDSFSVFNPITGIYIDIRSSVKVKDLRYIPLGFEDLRTTISGFGFDNINNDYKVVMFSRRPCSNNKIYVCSVKDRDWREVNNPTFVAKLFTSEVVVIDKHLFHFQFYDEEDREWIGCFDICNEQWSKYEVPYFISSNWDSLGVFNGCLCYSSDYQIWVLEPKNNSWRNIIGFLGEEPLTFFNNDMIDWPDVKPLGYSSEGSKDEILAWNERKHELITINVSDKTIKSTKIDGVKVKGDDYLLVGTPRCSSKAYFCNETLATIPGGRQFRTYHEPQKNKRQKNQKKKTNKNTIRKGNNLGAASSATRMLDRNTNLQSMQLWEEE